MVPMIVTNPVSALSTPQGIVLGNVALHMAMGPLGAPVMAILVSKDNAFADPPYSLDPVTARALRDWLDCRLADWRASP